MSSSTWEQGQPTQKKTLMLWWRSMTSEKVWKVIHMDFCEIVPQISLCNQLPVLLDHMHLLFLDVNILVFHVTGKTKMFGEMYECCRDGQM